MARLSVVALACSVMTACSEKEQLPPPPIDTIGDTEGIPEPDPCPVCELDAAACDADGDDVFTAIGANCPDRPVIDPVFFGNPDAIRVVSSIGGSHYVPQEGDNFTVMGTGLIDTLLTDSDACADLGAASLGDEYIMGTTLPAPIKTVDVGAVNCFDDPGLVGMGDCSNTIQTQFEQGQGAGDYSEMRFSAVVPDGADAIKFDFAFLTSEYPEYVDSQFNDMFIGWLESETWTGNISFDDSNLPISVNAGFLNFKDDMGTGAVFEGTCMSGHGGTRWLTSKAAVETGEEIELVVAIFDMGDWYYESYVLLDNFRWGCDGCAEPPSTIDETGGTGG
jgi:hypothetical protein